MTENFKFVEMAVISFMFRNDLHYLHHYVTGKNFDELHSILEEYYEKALEDFDYFSEKAITFGEKMINMNDLTKVDVTAYWDTISSIDNDFDEVQIFRHIKNRGEDYLEALDMIREASPEYVQSDIDTMRSYWSTEIEYKNEQRLKSK
jgi:DNA-binding ferritin-like protein